MSASLSSSAHQPPELHVYADSSCRARRAGEFAGYGVYAPVYSIRVAEPLPGRVQSRDRADLYALLAALELIHGVRARVAVIYIPSASAADGYETKLRAWHANRWRAESGRPVKHRHIWKDVWDLWNVFLDRGVDVTVQVRQRSSDHNMRVANRLAKHGAALHVTCELCRKTHGRQWGNHGCEPICDLDKCNGRVIKNVHSYMKHMQKRHQKKCHRKDCEEQFTTFIQEELDEHEREAHGGKVFPCDFCGEYFKSPRRVKRHIRSSCKEAPFCADCGRLFKSKKDLQRHNERKTSESESSSTSSSDYDRGLDGPSGLGETEGLVDDEIGLDLARHDFGRHGFGRHHDRGRGASDVAADEDDDDESESCESSSSSSSDTVHRKCHRHSARHGHGHGHGGSRHSSSRHSSGRHRHGGSSSSKHGGGKGHSSRGMSVTDREGRDWHLDEHGLHRRPSGGEQQGPHEPRWFRYGRGSE